MSMTTTAYTHSTFFGRLVELVRLAIHGLNALAPVGDLIIRLWVANVFWKSGLTKVQSLDTTVQLFRYEYSVPLLSPRLRPILPRFPS